MKSVNHWFWSAFSEHRSIYYRVMLAATLVNFMSIGSSIFIMVVYDRVVPNSAYESLYALTMGMALVIIFDYVLKMLRSYFIDYAGEFVDKKVGNSIFDMKCSYCFHNIYNGNDAPPPGPQIHPDFPDVLWGIQPF